MVMLNSIIDFRSSVSDAISRGDLQGVRFAIAGGVDCNARTSRGLTPLMEAAQNGRTAIAQFLISKGADINAQSEDGFTALILAAARCRSSMVNLLLQNGAQTHLKTTAGQTALEAASRAGDWTSMRLLMRAAQKNRMPVKLPMSAKSPVFSIRPVRIARISAAPGKTVRSPGRSRPLPIPV
jgi:ankyrin repeat protein